MSFKKFLESEDFLDEFREPNRFVRNRVLSMKNMILFLIFHPKKTLDVSWESFRKKFKTQLKLPVVSRQALSKARTGIKPELFREFFDFAVESYYAHTKNRVKWMGRYHLFAIDGSDFEAPSSKGTFEEFGKNSDRKNPGYFWSMAKISILYGIFDDIIVDAIIDKQKSHERDLAMQHLARLSDLGLHSDSVVIFDRGYFSADMFAECHNTGCKCLMRLRKCMNFCKLPGDDFISKVIAPDGTKIPCRILKVTLSTGETEHLITDIMDDDITCDMFGDLYFERWQIESKYLELKEHSKIEEFTGKTPRAVRQDFYITMFLTNIAAILKAAADEIIAANAKSKNRYKYQAKRTFIIGMVKEDVPEMLINGISLVKIEELVESASKKKSQIKPDRSYPRKRKRRARKHYNNRKATF
jgi:hypothetical protein